MKYWLEKNYTKKQPAFDSAMQNPAEPQVPVLWVEVWLQSYTG